MDYKVLKESWLKEEERSFKGWDFSYLEGRWDGEHLPWDYKSILFKYLKHEYRLLDMGTGGGEFLLTLGHPYKNTAITESWEPNVELCRETLAPLGITVKQVIEDSKLPFEDNSFDMIINRHESFDVKEISRILKPGGIFITQQVGGKNNEILSKRLIKDFKPEFEFNTLEYTVNSLKENSFEVIYEEDCYPYLRFFDVGAIVYFAKIIPWEFPNFSVEDSFDELCKIHKEIEEKSHFDSLEHRFIVVCKNMK